MKRTVPLFLAFLLLLGSVGVTVNRHFCMGELQSVALFAAAEACHEATAPACPMHAAVLSPPLSEGEGVAADCCNDEHELVKADDDRQLAEVPALPTGAWVMVAPPAPLFPQFSLHLRARPNMTFEQYRPPPKLIDAPRQFQVFRL